MNKKVLEARDNYKVIYEDSNNARVKLNSVLDSAGVQIGASCTFQGRAAFISGIDVQYGRLRLSLKEPNRAGDGPGKRLLKDAPWEIMLEDIEITS